MCASWWGSGLAVRASGMFITGMLLDLVLACPVCLWPDPEWNWRSSSWFGNDSCGDFMGKFQPCLCKIFLSVSTNNLIRA